MMVRVVVWYISFWQIFVSCICFKTCFAPVTFDLNMQFWCILTILVVRSQSRVNLRICTIGDCHYLMKVHDFSLCFFVGSKGLLLSYRWCGCVSCQQCTVAFNVWIDRFFHRAACDQSVLYCATKQAPASNVRNISGLIMFATLLHSISVLGYYMVTFPNLWYN